MGDDPKTCVVTPDLKVIGVNGVRVIDASVMPRIVGGQTGTPTVMIAERGAGFIVNPETAPKAKGVKGAVRESVAA